MSFSTFDGDKRCQKFANFSVAWLVVLPQKCGISHETLWWYEQKVYVSHVFNYKNEAMKSFGLSFGFFGATHDELFRRKRVIVSAEKTQCIFRQMKIIRLNSLVSTRSPTNVNQWGEIEKDISFVDAWISLPRHLCLIYTLRLVIFFSLSKIEIEIVEKFPNKTIFPSIRICRSRSENTMRQLCAIDKISRLRESRLLAIVWIICASTQFRSLRPLISNEISKTFSALESHRFGRLFVSLDFWTNWN